MKRRKLARHFHVSLTAACVALEDSGFGSESLLLNIPRKDDFKSGEGGFNPDPSTAANRLREYGYAIVGSIIEAEERGLLHRHDVLRYLRVGDDKFPELSRRSTNESESSGVQWYADAE